MFEVVSICWLILFIPSFLVYSNCELEKPENYFCYLEGSRSEVVLGCSLNVDE